MTIAEALGNGKKKLEYTGKTLFVRLTCYGPKQKTVDYYFGRIKKVGSTGLILSTDSGDMVFPAQREAIVTADERDYEIDGKPVKPELYAEFSLYDKRY